MRARCGAPPRGFTLIELVVVVTIVSVMSLGVVLGFGGGASLLPGVRASDPVAQARRFEQAMTEARDMALFGRDLMGVQPLATGWEVLRYDADAELWQPVARAGPLEMPLAWSIAGLPYPAPPERVPGAVPPIR
ncbi:MAG: prepilin-type N-terminal cleavage/methylation domain-containing protein, partial [Roseovarius sp.]